MAFVLFVHVLNAFVLQNNNLNARYDMKSYFIMIRMTIYIL